MVLTSFVVIVLLVLGLCVELGRVGIESVRASGCVIKELS